MPFWKTDLTGRALVLPRAAWEDQHAAVLECALPMDDGTTDSHGVVLNAPNTEITVAAVPAPTLVTGQNARFYGSCCSFAGGGAGLTVTFQTSLFGASKPDFTVETWVRVAETGDGALFSIGTDQVSVAIAGPNIVLCGDTSAPFARAVWAHVAVVRNGSTTVTLFVNGVPTCTSTPAIVATTTCAAFRVACLASDMRVYSKAKYAANFASSFTPTVVPASDITRVANSTTVSIGVTPSTYRTMRVYAGFADPGSGPSAEVAFSARAAEYVAPTGITCTFASQVYTLTGASVSVTTTGFTAAAPGNVTLLASKTSGDQAPAAVSDRVALSATGTATVALSAQTFASAGTWFLYARFSNSDGLFAVSLLQATGAGVAVADYALPTVAASTTSPVQSQMVAGTSVQCTVTLTGSNYTSLTAANLTIKIGTVAATGLTYAPTTGVASFTLTSPSGAYDVTLVISSPLVESTFRITRVIRSVFVDNAAGFTYPTSVTVSPASVTAGIQSNFTLTLSPAPSQSVSLSVYVGSTLTEALTTTATTVTTGAGTGAATVAAQVQGGAAQVYLFARIVSPSGVTGPVVQSAAVGVYTFPTVVGLVSSATLVQSNPSTVTLALSAAVPTTGTAGVWYATTTNASSPTLVGSYAVTATGTVSFTLAIPTLGSLYLYVKAKSPGGVEQPSFMVSQALTVRELTASDFSDTLVVNVSAESIAPAALFGTYEETTILGKRAMHIINTATQMSGNISGLVIPYSDIMSLSIWFYVTYRAVGNHFFLDGRHEATYGNAGPGGYVLPVNGNIEAPWSTATVYLNGGPSRPIADSFALLSTVSSSWQHMTIVLGTSNRLRLTMFSRFSTPRQDGMDINFSRIQVYNKALTERENRALYNAL